MLSIIVYPTKASALNVKHPHGPQMALGGVLWPKDSFTGRRLGDGSVTTDQTSAYVPPASAAVEIASVAPAASVVAPAPAVKPAPAALATPAAPAAPAKDAAPIKASDPAA